MHAMWRLRFLVVSCALAAAACAESPVSGRPTTDNAVALSKDEPLSPRRRTRLAKRLRRVSTSLAPASGRAATSPRTTTLSTCVGAAMAAVGVNGGSWPGHH